MSLQTAERVSHEDLSDNYVFQRSLLAYHEAAKLVSGNVLEIGTGSGYGVDIISNQADEFITIDKFPYQGPELPDNVIFKQMNVPPLEGIRDNSFDFVISFQVIEHIQNDHLFVEEIARVLKPGGAFILTTPNKKMSLTRNPWHVREYTIEELKQLLSKYFTKVDAKGVFGNEKIQTYYQENKASVQRLTRYDFLNLQYRLPRQILQIPYDILNRINRRKLLSSNTDLVSTITMQDYYVDDAKEGCFDLFYIAVKSS